VEALAYHYSRCGAEDRAAAYFEQAGDRAYAQYAYATAEAAYTAVVELRDSLGQPLEAARARRTLSATLQRLARYDQAITVMERAAADYRAAGDRVALAVVVAEIGEAYVFRGSALEGARWLEPQADELLRAADGSAAWRQATAMVLGALARQYLALGRHAEAVALSTRVVELRRAEGEEVALATALYRHGCVVGQLVGRIAEMRQVAEEACWLAEAAGDLNSLHWALSLSGAVCSMRGEWEAAQGYAERALQVAERRGDPGPLVDLFVSKGLVAFYRGEWAQARGPFERAQQIGLQISPSYPHDPSADLALLPLARLALVEGSWEVARRQGEEALALAQESGSLDSQRVAHGLLAELDLREGQAEMACARLAPLVDDAGLEERGVTPLLVVLAWALLERGGDQEAREAVARAIARLRRDDDRVELVHALRVQTLVAARQGDWAEAVRSVEEGLPLARAMPYPHGEACLLAVAGRLHAARGQADEGRSRLQMALALFRRLGAHRDAEETEQLLAALVEDDASQQSGTPGEACT
jgi:tetratricopeptide (TPR) repeat protein